jgi:hypothetical protein
MDLSTRIQILENMLRMNSLTRPMLDTYSKDDQVIYELDLIELASQLDRYLIITQGFRILDNYLEQFVSSKNYKFRKFIRSVRKVLKTLQTMSFALSDFDAVLIPQAKEEYIGALHEYLALDEHPEVIVPLLPKLRKIEINFHRLVARKY